MTRKQPWRQKHPHAVVVARPGLLPAIVSAPAWAVDTVLTRIDPARQKIWQNIDRLQGHDVACWCPLELPCHGDSYLIHANKIPAGVTAPRPCG